MFLREPKEEPVKQFDLIVVGAGPAGMAAAIFAATHGASVVILDEQPRLGGQIYRDVTRSTVERDGILGPDYIAGKKLTQDLITQDITHIPSANVWEVTPDGFVTFTVNGKAERIAGRFLLLATGALERSVPIPGWTTPGVMTAGAGQILLKTSGIVSKDAVLAGSGPLLYLLAAQMTAAGSPPLAIVETQRLSDHFRAAKYLTGAFRGRQAIFKGLGLLRILRKAGVRRITGAEGLEIIGSAKVEGMKVTKSGWSEDLICDNVFFHFFVVPNVQFSQALRLDHTWCETQRCFHPVTDQWGRTSSPTIYVAGDGAGIGGAKAAEHAGRVCAAQILTELDYIKSSKRDELVRPILAALRKELAVRPFLDTLYAVPEFIARPADPVIVCRCEEVTAGNIRQYAKLGCVGPNQTKAFGRPGMGPCQGRYCGLTVTDILASEHGKHPDQIGSYRIRMPVKPVTLGEVAALAPKTPK